MQDPYSNPHFLGFRDRVKEDNDSNNKTVSFIFETSTDPDAAEKNRALMMHALQSR